MKDQARRDEQAVAIAASLLPLTVAVLGVVLATDLVGAWAGICLAVVLLVAVQMWRRRG